MKYFIIIISFQFYVCFSLLIQLSLCASKSRMEEVDYNSGNPIALRLPTSEVSRKFALRSLSRIPKSLTSIIKSTFLPTGFPKSVPPEYLSYQTYNLIQDLCM